MGHFDGHISSQYCERIGNDRLVMVSEHVRGWLFPDESADEEAPATIKFPKAK